MDIVRGALIFEHDVFISYASEDLDIALELSELLKQKNLFVFMDRSQERGLTAGNPFREQIRNAVLASRKTIVLWSKYASKSQWVMHEMSLAAAFNRLISLWLDDEPPASPFKDQHHLRITNLNSHLPAIMRSINHKLHHPDDCKRMYHSNELQRHAAGWVNKFHKAKCIDQICQQLTICLQEQGFDRWAYQLNYNLRDPNYKSILYHTFPQEWIEDYEGQNFKLIDPIIQFGPSKVHTYQWTDLYKSSNLAEIQNNFLERACKYGLFDGLGYTIDSQPNEHFAILTISSTTMGAYELYRFHEYCSQWLKNISEAFHFSFSRLYSAK